MIENFPVIIMSSEVLFSLVFLGLVLYCINMSAFNASICLLLIMFFVFMVDLKNIDLFFYMCEITNGLLLRNFWVILSKLLVVLGSVSILLMVGEDKIMTKSLSGLIVLVALSSLLLISSINWLSIYLAIELQTLTLFVLVSLKRGSVYSAEAGLKYFVLGAVSSGLFLLGCVLLYGQTGEVSVQGINSILVVDVGKVLLTVSLLFKLSAAPFHMWSPDVYEGAPTLITALLAIVPKIGVYSILVQIGPVANIVLICAVFSIVCGAIGALNQTKIKRLLAYSGIGHIGFVLFGVAIGSFESLQASLIYMIIYVIVSICSFAVILYINFIKGFIIEISGFSRISPIVGLTLALIFFSTAGVPPLGGFLSKWLILLSGISSGYYLISIFIVISSVIAGVYYVRLVIILYFQPDSLGLVLQRGVKNEERMNINVSLLIGVTIYIIMFIMVCPNFIMQLSHDVIISLF